MYNLFRVFKKELLQLRRDPRMFPIVLIAPVMQLLFMGYAANMDVKHIPFVVWDQDGSKASREFVAGISATLYFDRVGTAGDYAQIENILTRGEALAALVIPRGYQEGLANERSVPVQLVIDGSDSNQAIIVRNYMTILAQLESAEVLTGRLRNAAVAAKAGGAAPAMLASGPVMAINPEPRVWYNPELRSANFMVPGVVVMILLVTTTMLTSLAVVREKEVGTLEQVIVSPIRPWQFILGKLLPFVIIGFIQVTLVLIIAVLWFEVPLRGSLPALYGYAALFLLTTLGLGLYISSISSNQQQAMMTAFFIMFTMVLLSGFMFPIENMPAPVQWLTTLIPMRYFLVIIRSLFLKGTGIQFLWEQAAALLALGTVVIGLSILRFGKTLD